MHPVRPWEGVVKQRKIEHVNHLPEHERKGSTGSYGLWPDEPVEITVNYIAHCSCRNQCQAYKNPQWDIRSLAESIYPPAQETEQNNPEKGEYKLAPDASDCHPERKSFIQDEMQLEPVPNHIDCLTKLHIRNDQDFYDLVNYY